MLKNIINRKLCLLGAFAFLFLFLVGGECAEPAAIPSEDNFFVIKSGKQLDHGGGEVARIEFNVSVFKSVKAYFQYISQYSSPPVLIVGSYRGKGYEGECYADKYYHNFYRGYFFFLVDINGENVPDLVADVADPDFCSKFEGRKFSYIVCEYLPWKYINVGQSVDNLFNVLDKIGFICLNVPVPDCYSTVLNSIKSAVNNKSGKYAVLKIKWRMNDDNSIYILSAELICTKGPTNSFDLAYVLPLLTPRGMALWPKREEGINERESIVVVKFSDVET